MLQYDSSVPAYLRDAALAQGLDDFTGGIGSARGPHVTLRNGRFFFVGTDGSEAMDNHFDPQLGPYIDVILVAANPGVSKVYYEGAYVQGESAPPTCFSNDGKYPDQQASVPQAPSCAACHNSVWGSETTQQGKQAKACSDRKRVAVLNLYDLKGPLYEISLSPSNLKPFAEYASQMKGRGIPLFGMVTRISVNPAAVGAMLFSPTVNPSGAGVWYVPEQVAGLISTARQSVECRKAIGLDATPLLPALNAPQAVPQIQHQQPAQQQVQQLDAPAPVEQPAATEQRKRRTKAEMEALRAQQAPAAVATPPAQQPAQQPAPQTDPFAAQQTYVGPAGIRAPAPDPFAAAGDIPAHLDRRQELQPQQPVQSGAPFGVVTNPSPVPPELDAMIAQLQQ